MPIVSSDIKYRLSGGAANADPALSLGGAKSSVELPVNFFDDISSSEALSGDTEYRCFYVHNNHATLTLQNAKAWIQTNTPSPDTDVAIGLGTSAINGTEQTVANEGTAPSGVSFSAPTTKGAGLDVGSIPPGQHKAIWVRRTAAPNSQAYNNDNFTVRTEGDTAA